MSSVRGALLALAELVFKEVARASKIADYFSIAMMFRRFPVASPGPVRILPRQAAQSVCEDANPRHSRGNDYDHECKGSGWGRGLLLGPMHLVQCARGYPGREAHDHAFLSSRS